MEHDEQIRKEALEIVLRGRSIGNNYTNIDDTIADAAKVEKFIRSGQDKQGDE